MIKTMFHEIVKTNSEKIFSRPRESDVYEIHNYDHTNMMPIGLEYSRLEWQHQQQEQCHVYGVSLLYGTLTCIYLTPYMYLKIILKSF